MACWQQICYEQNRKGLYLLALAVCGCPELAEDAIHDAFVRLSHASEPVGDASAYVFRTVRNVAIDLKRLHMRQVSTTTSLFETSVEPIRQGDDVRSIVQDREQIQMMVDSLDEQEKELVVLKIFAGLTYSEMEVILDTPAKTIASRYRRVIQSLRLRFEPHYD